MSMFGSSDMSLGISVILRDQFSASSRRISSSMRNMNAETKRAVQENARMQRNFNAAGAMIGVSAISQMAKWTKTGAEFGYTMKFVSAIAKENGVSYDKLGDKAKTLGEDTMFSAIQVSDAMRFMAMAGQDTAEIYNNIEAAVNLAGATMSEVGGKGGSADILTNVMKGFNIESTLENSTRVVDILATSATSANLSLFDLGEALKYSTSTAKDLNVTLEETSAMIMMAGDAGIQGSMAGTAVENMLRYITLAAGGDKKKANKSLAMMGLTSSDLRDSNGNLKDMVNLMATIGNAGEKMLNNNVDMQNVYKELFGVRGKREGSILLRNMSDLESFITLLNTGSQGKAAEIMATQMDTLKGRTLQLTSAWDSFKITFTEAIMPVIVPFIKILTATLKIINSVMSTPFGKWLAILGAGFIVAKTAVMGYRAITGTLSLLQMQVGNSMTVAAGKTVAGYNSMTAAASRYATAGAAASMMSPGGTLGRVGMMKSGGFYKTLPNGSKKFISGDLANRYAGMYGNKVQSSGKGFFGNLANRGRGIGSKMGSNFSMKGGMGIGMGGMIASGIGSSMSGDGYSAGGSAMSTLGSTLSMGGTGMMMGSMFGPIGTIVGGVAGAVAGLGMGIYDWVQASESNTDALDQNTNTLEQKNSMEQLDPELFWGRALKKSNGDLSNMSSNFGYASATNVGIDKRYDYNYLNSSTEKDNPLYRPDNTKGPEVNIYIDGEKKIQEVIDNKILYNNIELGLY